MDAIMRWLDLNSRTAFQAAAAGGREAILDFKSSQCVAPPCNSRTNLHSEISLALNNLWRSLAMMPAPTFLKSRTAPKAAQSAASI
jgi:hypothetical protein